MKSKRSKRAKAKEEGDPSARGREDQLLGGSEAERKRVREGRRAEREHVAREYGSKRTTKRDTAKEREREKKERRTGDHF